MHYLSDFEGYVHLIIYISITLLQGLLDIYLDFTFSDLPFSSS